MSKDFSYLHEKLAEEIASARIPQGPPEAICEQCGREMNAGYGEFCSDQCEEKYNAPIARKPYSPELQAILSGEWRGEP